MDWATGRGDRGDRARDREREREREVEQANEMNRRLEEIERQLREELRRREFNEIERLQLLARLMSELVQIQEELNVARGFR